MNKVLSIIILGLSVTLQAIDLPTPLVYAPHNIEKVRKLYDLTPNYDAPKMLSDVKVAILDEGFWGITPETMEKFLPKNTKIFDLKDSKIPGVNAMNDKSIHGLHMAQIVWAMSGLSKDGPQIGLFNVNGPDNQMAAIQALLEWGAHIVVQSANFEMFGNMNGTGWLNEHVEHARSKGVIWLSTAGNYKGLVHNGTVRLDSRKEWVKFAGGAQYLRFRNKEANQNLKIVLNWNSYSIGNELFKRPRGTDKDLDLYVGIDGDLDENGVQKWQAISNDTQVVALTGKANETLYAREVALYQAKPEDRDYIIAVKRKYGSFNDDDKFRVVVYPTTLSKRTFEDPKTGDKRVQFTFDSATKGFEIMTPADGAGLTVGSGLGSSSMGPTLDLRGKPDILTLNNDVLFSNMAAFDGESASNAIIGGIAAVLKGAQWDLKQEHLLKFRADYPEKVFENQGWRADNVTYFVNHRAISDYLLEHLGNASIRVQGTNPNQKQIGLLSNRRDVIAFRQLLENQGYDFKKYRVFLCAKEVGGDYVASLIKSPGDDFKAPWDANDAKNVYGREFYELKEIKVPAKPYVGDVQDGTGGDGRFWKTPTPERLREVVRGN